MMRNACTRVRGLLGRILLLTVVACVPALADFSFLDFRAPYQTSGSISYDGTGGPLLGTNIGLNSYFAVGTPLHSGTGSCVGCKLNFSTGNLTDASRGAWVFGDGGAVTVAWDGVIGLTGSFSAAAVQPLAGGAFQIAIGGFQAQLNPSFAAYFGLPTDRDYLGAMGLQFITGGIALPPGGFGSSAILGGDLAITPAPPAQSVPEPTGTLWLLGLSAAAVLLLAPRLAARQS